MFSFHVKCTFRKTARNLMDADREIVCLFIFNSGKTRVMSYFLLGL